MVSCPTLVAAIRKKIEPIQARRVNKSRGIPIKICGHVVRVIDSFGDINVVEPWITATIQIVIKRDAILGAMEFSIGQRKQCQHTHANSQGLRYLLLEDKVPRAGEDVLAWSANSVGFDLDNVKEFRRKPSLIDDQWCRMGSDKPKGVGIRGSALTMLFNQSKLCKSISILYVNQSVWPIKMTKRDCPFSSFVRRFFCRISRGTAMNISHSETPLCKNEGNPNLSGIAETAHLECVPGMTESLVAGMAEPHLNASEKTL